MCARENCPDVCVGWFTGAVVQRHDLCEYVHIYVASFALDIQILQSKISAECRSKFHLFFGSYVCPILLCITDELLTVAKAECYVFFF